MKILVFAHRLEVGGTQVNAIDLAAGLRDFHGCDVTLFAAPGPMVRMAEAKGLKYVPAPDSYRHPSPARIRALRELVRTDRPDVIHVWDWWQCLEAYYGVHLPMRIPLVATHMMMDLTRVLPVSPPTTFGTPDLVEQARRAGRRHAELLLPPVNVSANAPGVIDARDFRKRLGISEGEIVVSSVSRLATWMKSEGLIRAIRAVWDLAREFPIKYVIVGDGLARDELEKLAARANEDLGRQAIVFSGALLDPRPAYEAADIVLGMGSSALRGLAFGKSVIVLGERAFAVPFSPETADQFLYHGFYGLGDGNVEGHNLRNAIRDFCLAQSDAEKLGEFNRDFVVQHFSLEVVTKHLESLCRRAISEMPSRRVSIADAIRTAAVYVRERRFLTPSRDKVPLDQSKEPLDQSTEPLDQSTERA